MKKALIALLALMIVFAMFALTSCNLGPNQNDGNNQGDQGNNDQQPDGTTPGDDTPVEDPCGGDHNWMVESKIAATCYSEGTATYVCTVCSAQKTDVLKMTAHNKATIAARAATCTEDGNTRGSYCRNSGCTFKEGGEVIPATGHAVITSASLQPTCVLKGYSGAMAIDGATSIDELDGVYNVCFVIDNAYVLTFDKAAGTLAIQDNINNEDHNATGNYTYAIADGAVTVYTADGAASSIKIAADDNGVTIDIIGAGEHCSVCLNIITEPAVTYDALGHDLVDAGYIAPTCASEGSIGGTHCSRCGHMGEAPSEILPKLKEHSAEFVVVSRADCVNDGYSECPVCKVRVKSEDSSPDKHLWVIDTPAVAPNCATETDGKTAVHKCSICETAVGGVTVEWEILHEDGNDACTITWIETIPATETSAGEKLGTCSGCDLSIRVDIPVISGGDFNEDNNIYPEDIIGTPPAQSGDDEE